MQEWIIFTKKLHFTTILKSEGILHKNAAQYMLLLFEKKNEYRLHYLFVITLNSYQIWYEEKKEYVIIHKNLNILEIYFIHIQDANK